MCHKTCGIVSPIRSAAALSCQMQARFGEGFFVIARFDGLIVCRRPVSLQAALDTHRLFPSSSFRRYHDERFLGAARIQEKCVVAEHDLATNNSLPAC